jgi:hypothetical protein
MFLSASLLSYALLASTVFAVPTSRLDSGIARRVGRLFSPFRPADGVSEHLFSARKNGGSGGNSGGGGGNGGNTSKTATVTATRTSTTATSSLPSSTDSAVLTSSIWAGAGMESPANTYKSVTGQLTAIFRVVIHTAHLCCRNSRCSPSPACNRRGEHWLLRGLCLGWSGRHDLPN